MSNLMQEKLTEAINAKENDLNSFVWKFQRQADGTQPSILLVDATPEQLKQFYDQCNSMLYNSDKKDPGRYVVLEQIREQRNKCNVELFIRKIENGSIMPSGEGQPRFVFFQSILKLKAENKEYFMENDFDSTRIKEFPPFTNYKLPREYENITVREIREACLDQFGFFRNKHITFNFILNMGLYLTPEEKREFTVKDLDGNKRNILEVVKERLNIRNNIKLITKQGGLSFAELRAMLNLGTKKYSELTTDQLTILRNKVLLKLENEVLYHSDFWEKKLKEILRVASAKGISL